ncbi:MAG: phage tail sheath [Gallionellaceae bacterium]|nr:MAG: phage tail sheath [Gallionellaceae bacterium]
MAANFLHGVETIKSNAGNRPVKLVKSAVTGLVGIAPIGAVNVPILVAADKDMAQFGVDLPGFTIISALDANFDQGRPTSGVVVVINVLDPAIHKTAVANEDVIFNASNDLAALAHPAVADLVLKSGDGLVTYTKDVDYTLAPLTGKLTRKAGGTIALGATVKAASYNYADPTKVTPADIIGGINAAGNRTGMQAFLDTYSLMGFFPKRLIAPVFCTLNSVATEMIAMANRLRARAYIDAPIGITRAQAIAGRGPMGTINFNTSAGRAKLFYPHVKVYDAATNSERMEPLSQRAAGIGNAIDIEKGYWWSQSNNEIAGITGMERTISAMINDPNCDANLLNEVGITTVFNNFGTGLRLWGNRMASWPANTDPETFECVLAVGDIIDESIEYFSLQYTDNPGSKAWADSITESVNGFLRKLRKDGAIVDGRCWFDPADNTVEEMAAGHYVFSRDYMPPTPAERITHKTRVNIDYLNNLLKR